MSDSYDEIKYRFETTDEDVARNLMNAHNFSSAIDDVKKQVKSWDKHGFDIRLTHSIGEEAKAEILEKIRYRINEIIYENLSD